MTLMTEMTGKKRPLDKARITGNRKIIQMIKGVLFDMDGVLVDSEPFICKAAIMMFSELGWKCIPEDFQPFIGMGENRYIGGVAEKYGISVLILMKVKARTYEIYEEIVRGKLEPLPGLMNLFQNAGIRV